MVHGGKVIHTVIRIQYYHFLFKKTMCIAQNVYYFMQYMVADALCDQYL